MAVGDIRRPVGMIQGPSRVDQMEFRHAKTSTANNCNLVDLGFTR
jgi:hypothetical protein